MAEGTEKWHGKGENGTEKLKMESMRKHKVRKQKIKWKLWLRKREIKW